MKQRIYFILIVALMLSGCTDFLNVHNKGLVHPRTVEQYSKLLKNYGKFTPSTTNAYFYNDEIKIYSDEVSRIPWGYKQYINGYLFKDYLYDKPDGNDRDWNNFYSQIYICNQVLANIDDAPGNNEKLRKEAKGEALAQRAYAYLMLVNLYGKAYDPKTADTDLGVPLMLKPDINAKKPRATVKEVYDLIEKNLLTAAKLLPEDTEFNYHPTKAGAYGLLAKMYFYMGDWTNAKKYSNKALQYNHFLYDYNNFDFIPHAPPFAGLAGYPKDGLQNKECIWFKQSINLFVYNVAVYMTDEYKSLFDPGDRRLYFRLIDAFVFGPNKHGKTIFTKEFYYKAGITVPQQLLIRAEANARLKNASAAIHDLNTLRKKRFDMGKFVPYDDTVSPEKALKLVLKERQLELFFNPSRLFDLKRLNKDPRFAKTVTRTFDGKTYTIKPGDKNYVIAIPKKVMNLNSKIKQNPRAGR